VLRKLTKKAEKRVLDHSFRLLKEAKKPIVFEPNFKYLNSVSYSVMSYEFPIVNVKISYLIFKYRMLIRVFKILDASLH
jgi:hypothetical protein